MSFETPNKIVQDTVSALADLKSFAGLSKVDSEEDTVALDHMIGAAKTKLREAESAADEADNAELLKLSTAIDELSPVLEGKNDGLIEDSKKMSARIRSKITPPSTPPKTPSPSDAENAQAKPEQPKTFFDTFEGFQNMIAKNIAPLLEQLQGLGIGTFLSFLGMNRVLIFSSLHKNGIDFELNADPKEDRKAINALTGMAKNVQAISPKYELQMFFEAVALDFAKSKNTNGQKFSLEDIADFAAKNETLIQKQERIAAELNKTPATPAPAAAPIAAAPAPAVVPPAAPTPAPAPVPAVPPATSPTPTIPPPPPTPTS